MVNGREDGKTGLISPGVSSSRNEALVFREGFLFDFLSFACKSFKKIFLFPIRQKTQEPREEPVDKLNTQGL